MGGNAKSVASQLDALRALGPMREVYEEAWSVLRTQPPKAAAWRWSQRPALFGETWVAADLTRELGTMYIHGNPARGVVRMLATGGTPAQVARVAVNFRGTVIPESLPERAWSLLPPRTAEDALPRAVRAKFDPAGILNPGIMGDGR
jgi:hypothetical protein